MVSELKFYMFYSGLMNFLQYIRAGRYFHILKESGFLFGFFKKASIPLVI